MRHLENVGNVFARLRSRNPLLDSLGPSFRCCPLDPSSEPWWKITNPLSKVRIYGSFKPGRFESDKVWHLRGNMKREATSVTEGTDGIDGLTPQIWTRRPKRVLASLIGVYCSSVVEIQHHNICLASVKILHPTRSVRCLCFLHILEISTWLFQRFAVHEGSELERNQSKHRKTKEKNVIILKVSFKIALYWLLITARNPQKKLRKRFRRGSTKRWRGRNGCWCDEMQSLMRRWGRSVSCFFLSLADSAILRGGGAPGGSPRFDRFFTLWMLESSSHWNTKKRKLHLWLIQIKFALKI